MRPYIIIVQNEPREKHGAFRWLERSVKHHAGYAAQPAGGRTKRRGFEPSTTLATGHAPPSCTAERRRMYYFYLFPGEPQTYNRDSSHRGHFVG